MVPLPTRIFTGRFSAARSATSRDVSATLREGAVVIDQGDGAAPIRWRLSALEIADPILPNARDVLIHEPARAGGTLFVADPDFVAALAAQAPQLTARARRWQGARPFVYVTAAVGAITALVYITDFSPARGIARMLPHSTRAALGREVIRSTTSGRPACDAAAGKAALALLAKRLSDAAGGKTAFKVTVADVNVVNAFAAPGEQIVILRKLLETAESADEVAGVLAHEMGHGIELHPEAGIVRAVGLMALTEFVLGGSGGTLANIGLYLTQLGYSRQAERQADAQAVRILKAAGISTQGIIDFFKRMSKHDGEPKDAGAKTADDTLSMLRTHPSTAERMAMFAAQPTYPATPALSDDDWRALKSICGPAKASPAPAPDSPGKPAPPGSDAQRDI